MVATVIQCQTNTQIVSLIRVFVSRCQTNTQIVSLISVFVSRLTVVSGLGRRKRKKNSEIPIIHWQVIKLHWHGFW